MIELKVSKMWLIVLIVYYAIQTNAFNLDVVNYIRQEGAQDSMFGFSVALHREAQKSWLVFLIILQRSQRFSSNLGSIFENR